MVGVGQSAEMTVIVEGAEQVPVVEAASTLTEVRDPPLKLVVPSLKVDPVIFVAVMDSEVTALSPVNEPPLKVALPSVRVGAVSEPDVERELDPRETVPVIDVRVPPSKTMLQNDKENGERRVQHKRKQRNHLNLLH